MLRRFFLGQKLDPVTGRTFDRQDWNLEKWTRSVVADIRAHGVVGWPDVNGLGLPDPDHSLMRGEIAFWLSEDWAYEAYCFDPDDTSTEVSIGDRPGWDVSDLLVGQMTNGDVALLLKSIPDDPKDPRLPDRRAVRGAIDEVPEIPGSLERHQWRFDLRKAALEAGREGLYESARAEQGGGTGPLTDFTNKFFADVEVELEAGYCGHPDCGYCSDPFST